MAWKNSFMALGLAAALLPASSAIAADHQDGAAALTDPSTDINDVYAWMSPDGTKVYLAMTVFPAATAASQFSNSAYYVFHTASRQTFLSMTATPLDIICGFDSSPTQNISCWVGDNTHFVYGNANVASGITSSDGQITVFAGPRKDEFFFNLQGFKDVVTLVTGLTTKPTADTNGCFAMSVNNAGGLSAAQTMVARSYLNHTGSGTMPPVDHFAALDTLAIVMSIPTVMLNNGSANPILSVWGATVKKN